MFDAAPEIAKVVELDGGITCGLASVNVFVSVMLKYELVALRTDQKFPPFEVAVETGKVNALNPELVT